MKSFLRAAAVAVAIVAGLATAAAADAQQAPSVEKLPVLFWIHGGSLWVGAGSDYDASKLALDGKACPGKSRSGKWPTSRAAIRSTAAASPAD